MPKINYASTSPYFATTQTSWYMGKYTHRPIPASPEDVEFTITQQYEGRPDKLAYDLYGSAEYWWVFSVRNRNILKHPLWDMTINTTIIVPSAAHIKKVVG